MCRCCVAKYTEVWRSKTCLVLSGVITAERERFIDLASVFIPDAHPDASLPFDPGSRTRTSIWPLMAGWGGIQTFSLLSQPSALPLSPPAPLRLKWLFYPWELSGSSTTSSNFYWAQHFHLESPNSQQQWRRFSTCKNIYISIFKFFTHLQCVHVQTVTYWHRHSSLLSPLLCLSSGLKFQTCL